MSKFLFLKKGKTISFLIFLTIFLIMFFINSKTPLWSDDWAFYVSYGEHRAQSIAEVFSSISYYYFNVNGRSTSNFITMLFVFFGKNVFNFFNALIFIFLGYAIYFFASDGKKIKPIGIAGIFLLLWFFVPAPNQTLFWQAGSAYLWMTSLCLLFLMPFFGLLVKNKIMLKNNFTNVVSMFFLGLLAGNSHEFVAPIVILSALIIVLLRLKEKRNVPRWCYGGLVGTLMGFAAQLVAPGNYKKNIQGGDSFDFIGGFGQVYKKVIDNQLILWEMIGVIIILYILNKIFFKSEKKIIDFLMFYLLAIALVMNVMGVVYPYFPPRALFFSSIILIIFISRFLLLNEFVKIKYLLILIFVPFFILSAKNTISDSSQLYAQYQKREASILQQKSEGVRNIVVGKIKKTKNPMLLNDPLLPHQDHNFWASHFYGVDVIDLN